MMPMIPQSSRTTELEHWKIETTLLKELNKELQEKNYFLKELLNAEKEKVNTETVITKKTYAEATVNNNPLKEPIPKIIIQKTKEIKFDDINKIKKGLPTIYKETRK